MYGVDLLFRRSVARNVTDSGGIFEGLAYITWYSQTKKTSKLYTPPTPTVQKFYELMIILKLPFNFTKIIVDINAKVRKNKEIYENFMEKFRKDQRN